MHIFWKVRQCLSLWKKQVLCVHHWKTWWSDNNFKFLFWNRIKFTMTFWFLSRLNEYSFTLLKQVRIMVKSKYSLIDKNLNNAKNGFSDRRNRSRPKKSTPEFTDSRTVLKFDWLALKWGYEKVWPQATPQKWLIAVTVEGTKIHWNDRIVLGLRPLIC